MQFPPDPSSRGCTLFRNLLFGCSCLLAVASPLRAEPPVARRLLPPETIAFITVPNAAQARTRWKDQSPAKLWADPAMGPFRDHFGRNYERRVLEPLTALTSVAWKDLFALAEGQLTLALLQSTPTNGPAGSVSQLLVLDAGARLDRLTTLFEAAREAPLPQGVTRTNISIHGVDFLNIEMSQPAWRGWLETAFPPPPNATPPQSGPSTPQRLLIGRSGSVLVAATAIEGLEAVVARLDGPADAAPPDVLLAALESEGSREVLCHGFLTGPAILTHLQAALAHQASRWRTFQPLPRILRAMGLGGIQSVTLAVRARAEGWFLDLQLAAPAAGRTGLLKLLELEVGETAPPPFIPADVLTYRRFRMPGESAWRQVERIVRDIDPSLLGLLQLLTGYAGKTEDADFDFDKGIIEKLGNDWIAATFRTPATGGKPAGDAEPQPQGVLLIGTPTPADLFHGLNLIAAPTYLATFLPPDAPAPVRSETPFHGRTLMSVATPIVPWSQSETGALHVVALDEYVAMAGSPAALEPLVSDPPAPSLKDTPAFARAVATLGGSQGGALFYRNEREVVRAWFEKLRRSPETLTERLGWAAFSERATRTVSAIASWLELGSLPPFEHVAKHFGFSLGRGGVTPSGLHITLFRPSTDAP